MAVLSRRRDPAGTIDALAPGNLRVLVNAMRTGVGAQGNAVYTRELVRGLGALAGVDLHVLAPSDQDGVWKRLAPHSTIHTVILAPHPLGLMSERRALKRICAITRPEVFHSPNTLLPLWRPSCVTVVTVHDLGFRSLPQGALKGLYKSAIYRYSALRADALIAVSHHTEATLLHHYPVTRGRVRVIWNGHPYSVDWRPGQPLLGQQRCVGGFKPYLLTFAHHRHKNAEAAVRVLQVVRRSGLDVRLKVLGGNSAGVTALTRLADGLGLSNCIDLLGYLEGDRELEELYSGASALIFLSRYEGFGLPVLEAMALGCPVVVSDRGSLPEIASGLGCVVDPDNYELAAVYVLRLLHEPEWALTQRSMAKLHASQWTWKRSVSDTLALYRELKRESQLREYLHPAPPR